MYTLEKEEGVGFLADGTVGAKAWRQESTRRVRGP